MKKLVAFVFALIVAVTSVGCRNTLAPKSTLPGIESHFWMMNTVQQTEKDGQIVAYSANYDGAPKDAVKMELSCKADGGQLTLTDTTHDKTYHGTYKTAQTSSSSTIYDISIEKKHGMAVVSATTYHDGSQTMTLILRLEDTAIHFFEAAD